MTEGRIRILNRPSMVDLLAPDAPHDVALLGDAAVQDSELRSPLRRYERTHVALTRRSHVHGEKEGSGALSGGTREHMSLTGPIAAGGAGGVGVETRLIVIVLVCCE